MNAVRNLLCLIVLMGSGCLHAETPASTAPPTKFQQLGKVIFGDDVSEQQAALQATASKVGPGAPGSKARYIAKEGEVHFTLPVDSARPTFVTLKMWGGDAEGATITLEGRSITLGVPHVDLWVNGKGVDLEAYEVLDSQPDLPGRYFFRTIRLPDEATHGQSKLDLVLKPLQQVVNGYAGAPPSKVVAAGVYSRGYYEAFTHIGNFYPGNVEAPAPLSEVKTEAPDFVLIRTRLIANLDLATGILMSRQLYGPSFDEAATRLKIPPAVHGLFDRDGLAAYLENGQKSGDWLRSTTGSGSGRLHADCGTVFMHCYGLEGSRYFHDPEMLSRTIAMLDAYRRYQGVDGGYEIGGGDYGWIGGPQRKRANGGLQGFFMGAIARSFLALWPYVKDHPEILEAKIDSDGDGQPDVTRREAWTAIFHEYLKGQGKMPGGVANQARANAIGATEAHRALQTLAPGDTIGEEELKTLVEQSVGLVPHPRDGGTWMLTRAGVSLEGPGFCPAYGQHANGQFADLIETYPDPRLKDQFAKELDLFSYMVFPLEGSRGGSLLVSGPEGSRHHDFPGPILDWTKLIPAALDMDNAFAGWAIGHELELSRNLETPVLRAEMGVHLSDAAVEAGRALDHLPDLQKELAKPAIKNYVLPSMAADWRNKNDAQVGLEMLHDAHRTLYLQAVRGGRYHFIGERVQAFGNVDYEEKDGVRVILYGPWLVAQNMTATYKTSSDQGRDAVLTTLPAVTEARDLVSGKMMKLDKPLTLSPMTTVIFDMEALGNPDLRKLTP